MDNEQIHLTSQTDFCYLLLKNPARSGRPVIGKIKETTGVKVNDIVELVDDGSGTFRGKGLFIVQAIANNIEEITRFTNGTFRFVIMNQLVEVI
jgi:hypothetical protein